MRTFLEVVESDECDTPKMRRCASAPALVTPEAWIEAAIGNTTGPREHDLDGEEAHDAEELRLAVSGGEGQTLGMKTTVVLRNLPYLLSVHALLGMLDSAGLRGKYDFVFFPRDFYTRQGLGYAFVNATGNEEAHELIAAFHGRSSWPIPGQKVCEVRWARRQGLMSQINHFKRSVLNDPSVPDEFKPVILDRGEPVALPASTRRLPPLAPFRR